jgi:hypothetical protein
MGLTLGLPAASSENLDADAPVDASSLERRAAKSANRSDAPCKNASNTYWANSDEVAAACSLLCNLQNFTGCLFRQTQGR